MIISELLEPIGLNSREFNHEILPVLTKSYKDRDSIKNFNYSRAYMVHNRELLNEVKYIVVYYTSHIISGNQIRNHLYLRPPFYMIHVNIFPNQTPNSIVPSWGELSV